MADYFNYNRRRGNSLTQDRLNAPLPPGPEGRPLSNRPSRESMGRNPSSIRIRRLPSSNAPRPISQASEDSGDHDYVDAVTTGRRRSTSAPQRPSNLAPPENDLSRQRTADPYMTTITEGTPMVNQGSPMGYDAHQQGGLRPSTREAAENPQMETPMTPSINVQTPGADPVSRITTGASAMHSAGNAAKANRGLRRYRSTALLPTKEQQANTQSQDEYNSDVVDLLNLVGKF